MAFLFRKKTDEEKAAAAARAEQTRRLKELEKAAKQQQKEAREREKRAKKEARALEQQAKKELAALEKQAKRADKQAERERKLAERKAKRARAKEEKQRRRRDRRRRSQRARSSQEPTAEQAARRARPTAPRFAKRDHCHACAKSFTVTRRRHHCRMCRASCCLTCIATTRRALPVYGQRRPQKVCVVCDVLVFARPDSQADAVTPPSTTALPAALPVEQAPPTTADNSADGSLAAPLVRLAVNGRTTRRPNSAPLPSRSTGSAPVVRVSTRRPKSSTRSSRWMGLKRKASAPPMRWGDPIPVGRKRLDLHLAKTAELLARGPSRAVELRVERQPHEEAAVTV